MTKPMNRRKILASAVTLGLSVGSVGFAPMAFARTGEDPVAVIESFANELFALFEPLNGVSESYGSRRRALRKLVDARFAYDQMIETAATIAVPELSSSERSRLHGIGRDLVVEFLMSFFVRYTSQHRFSADGVRDSRGGNRSILETTLVSRSGSDIPIRWDLIQVGQRCKVLDVRVFGISLINDVAQDAYNAFEDGGTRQMFSVLERKVRNFRSKFPD